MGARLSRSGLRRRGVRLRSKALPSCGAGVRGCRPPLLVTGKSTRFWKGLPIVHVVREVDVQQHVPS